MKKIVLLVSAFCISQFGTAQLVSKSLVVPEFSNGLIVTYFPTSATTIGVTNSAYTIDLKTLGNGLATNGSPNCVAMVGNDLFVAITSANQRIYKFPGYGTNPTTAKANVSQVTNVGSDYVGIAFDASGNLYASEGSYLDTKIVKYTAASAYATRIDLGNGGLTSYFANITFDGTGNLWASDYKNNRIIAIASGDLSTSNAPFHVCTTNTTAWSVGGTNANLTAALNVKSITTAFSQPEGVAFDNSGFLWVANNNDSGANAAPTLVRLSVAMQNTILQNTTTAAVPNMTNSTNGFKVWNLPSSTSGRGQLGGMQIDKALDRIYVNEQVSQSGMWFDIANISSITDTFLTYKLSITSTNPGNGGIFLASNSNILGNQNFERNATASLVFPNPSQGNFQIDNENLKSVKAFDLNGRSIPILKTAENQYEMQQSGTYLLQLENNDGAVSVQKIIVN